MAEELAAPPALPEEGEYSGAPLSLQTLDPTQREQVMRYLLTLTLTLILTLTPTLTLTRHPLDSV